MIDKITEMPTGSTDGSAAKLKRTEERPDGSSSDASDRNRDGDEDTASGGAPRSSK